MYSIPARYELILNQKLCSHIACHAVFWLIILALRVLALPAKVCIDILKIREKSTMDFI